MKTLAHLSDLHLGESPMHQRRAARLVDLVLELGVDHVVVTGDVTHHGLFTEYELFEGLFRPLRAQGPKRGRLTVVPGNHDRAGDDVAELLCDELRVSVDARDELFMVCIDSTAPHNRRTFRSHGALGDDMVAAVREALALAPRGCLSCVLVHHHVLPLPVEGLGEWFADTFGWPHAGELPLGRELLRRVAGRCDLLLHGHRHVPRHVELSGARPLQVFNAGSSTQLQGFRLFTHDGPHLVGWRWVHLDGGYGTTPTRLRNSKVETPSHSPPLATAFTSALKK
jgi:3',5'-cyclic AMP phosphodiesterase CpdA